MKNQVKVKETEVFQDPQGKHTVCRGRLVLIKSQTEADLMISNVYINNISYTAIIVSNTEKANKGDLILFEQEILTVRENKGHYLSTYEYPQIDVRADLCNKILASPENFSRKQLQAIIDGKIIDGMEVFVECYKRYKEDWVEDNLDGEPTMFYDYKIQLDSQSSISMFPIVKNNDLADRLFKLANDFATAKQGDIAVKLHSIHNTL